MKILLGVHQFFPEYSAGTEVLTLSVARGLAAAGHEVRVFAGFPASADRNEEDRFDQYVFEGITVVRFHHAYVPMGGQSSMIDVGYDNRLSAKYFQQLLQDFSPDVVHFFHLNRIGSRLIEVARAQGVPCYLTTTDFWSICTTAQLLLPSGCMCDGPDANSVNCVMHFTSGKQGGALARLASHLPRPIMATAVRVAAWDHCPDFPFRHEMRALSKRLDVNVRRLNLLHQILVPTVYMRDLLIRYGVRSELIRVRSFGVKLPPTVGRYRAKVAGQPLRIGFIGTLAPHKGCHVLLDALRGIASGKVKLSIYGRGEDFPEYTAHLKRQAASVDGVEWKGTFPNDAIGRVLDELDVLVVPSTWRENTPLVVHSALASRCPVIVSNVGGLTEAVTHGENGLTFGVGDSHDLFSQINRLITEDGLLAGLSRQCVPPKTSEAYLLDLMEAWGVQ